MINQLKIINKSVTFFELDFVNLLKITLIGVVFGLISWYVVNLFGQTEIINHRLGLILAGLISLFLLLLLKVERALMIELACVILLWSSLNCQLILYLLVASFWHLFFGWLSQVRQFKAFFGIITISILLLKLFL